MTDVSLPVKAINAHDFPRAALPAAAARHASPAHYDAPGVDEADADDTISCVCGFSDDDGWTVQCDKCNRWQHQLCYYPEYEEKTLPDIEHFCVDCRPRPLDVTWARSRQRQKRDAQASSLSNGARRGVSKSTKKKKDSVSATYANDWPADKNRHDQTSASPRDQPPPPKRPKTSHRTSDSTTATVKGHSRKRNASTVQPRRSLSRSPDTPVVLYTDEFLRSYKNDNCEMVKANVYGISTVNTLSQLLTSHDDDFRQEVGLDKTDVYARWEGDLDDIPGRAQLEVVEYPDDSVQCDGAPLVWKALTVREPIAGGAYIGELMGLVVLKSDYQGEPANRWSTLRHPLPFVFFHPNLPAVIDARTSGNELRYIRRSCTPNARIQVLVTGGSDHHFCFMSTQQIEPGMEITIPWDTLSGLPELSSKTQFDHDYKVQLSTWVSNVLANCGPCACALPEGSCKMERFDRRGKASLEDAPPIKAPKSKKRKAAHQISPANTHALNSRSGSEVRRVDNDDEEARSRSTSASASRDITPHANGLSTAMPELSERERKKLAKEEEMFRRQEEERSGKQAKKKRSSGGSNLAAGASSSKSSRYVDAGTSRQSSLSVKVHARQKSKSSKSGAKTPTTPVVKRAKPEYVSSGVQCDMDEEEERRRAATMPPRRIFMPLRQRLLERCARNNALVSGAAASAQAELRRVSASSAPSAEASDKMDTDEVSTSAQQPLSETNATASRPSSSHNAASLPQIDEPKPPPTTGDAITTKTEPVDEDKAPSPIAKPELPIPRVASSPPPMAEPATSKAPPPALKLDMAPPSSTVPLAHASGTLAPPPSAATLSAVSPSSPAALSPSVAASSVVTPVSPAVSAPPAPAVSQQQQSQQRKKMSLSEYSKRNKNRGPAPSSDTPAPAGSGSLPATAERESSPASSTVSGPVTAGGLSAATSGERDRVVSTSSLASATAEEETTADGSSKTEPAPVVACDADVKMEDAADAPSVAAASVAAS